MKYIIQLNQKACIDLGITNPKQAFIFDFLTTAATWADPVVVDGEVYYWVSRTIIAKELQILGIKDDTIYRHLKALDKIGVIKYKKSKGKDLIQITQKGKAYLFDNYGIDLNKNTQEAAEKKLNNKINVQKVFNAFGIDIKTLENFISYRKAIGKPIKTTKALEAFARNLLEIKKAGFDLNEAIELMQEREWMTVKLEYLQNSKASPHKKSSGFDLSGEDYSNKQF